MAQGTRRRCAPNKPAPSLRDADVDLAQAGHEDARRQHLRHRQRTAAIHRRAWQFRRARKRGARGTHAHTGAKVGRSSSRDERGDQQGCGGPVPPLNGTAGSRLESRGPRPRKEKGPRAEGERKQQAQAIQTNAKASRHVPMR
ncbi:hypothetical protein ERJ75_000174200 [Trypanosoma vivax]|nr:hypothetical protein ERJ75_000174200 [Trypanosoma vivax]